MTSDSMPTLKPQEIPLDHPDSNCMFRPGPDKPFMATPAAIDTHSHEVILRCWQILRENAHTHNGLDYLQIFQRNNKPDLWFIEDGSGGAITALLGSDY